MITILLLVPKGRIIYYLQQGNKFNPMIATTHENKRPKQTPTSDKLEVRLLQRLMLSVTVDLTETQVIRKLYSRRVP